MNAPGFLRTWFRLGYCADPAEIHDRGLSVVDLAGPYAFVGAIGSLALLAVWALGVSPIASAPGVETVASSFALLVAGLILAVGVVPVIILWKYVLASGGGESA